MGGGRLEPVGEFSQCPCADGDNLCRLKRHSYRARKTGPRFPVRVLYCHTHQRYFTVYPMGHIPYGRERLAPVDPSGWPRDGEESSIAQRWKKTLFCSRLRGGGRSTLVEGGRTRRSCCAALRNSRAVGQVERSLSGVWPGCIGASCGEGCPRAAGSGRRASASEKRLPAGRDPGWQGPSGVGGCEAFAGGQAVVVSPSACGMSRWRLETGHYRGTFFVRWSVFVIAEGAGQPRSALANEKVSSRCTQEGLELESW